MDIDSQAEFAADPHTVFGMLTDQSFQEKVCTETYASKYEVSIEGSTVKTSRELPAPDAARPFTGSTLTVVEEISWAEPAADGSRTGTVAMRVPGQPVTFNGKYELQPGDAGTRLSLGGVLKVNVPMLGKKLEEAAAPAVLGGFRTQQKVGADWLAG